MDYWSNERELFRSHDGKLMSPIILKDALLKGRFSVLPFLSLVVYGKADIINLWRNYAVQKNSQVEIHF